MLPPNLPLLYRSSVSLFIYLYSALTCRIEAYTTPENSTTDDLTPIISDMILVLNDTISGMTETLSGKTLEDILTTADGVVLTTDDVAQLVSGLITVSLTFNVMYPFPKHF